MEVKIAINFFQSDVNTGYQWYAYGPTQLFAYNDIIVTIWNRKNMKMKTIQIKVK